MDFLDLLHQSNPLCFHALTLQQNDNIGKDIEKACQSIYPLHDVFVRKVKMLKKPKFELGKLMELHGEGISSGKATGDETGAKVK
ncbi:40S ribosomal protein S3a [Tupaia chinensis]|uniref:40S ribosomal protein S3a n=1 Tax=Tupaia chinensis TaxID=246437 RepID=L9L812_TUPCH|nr:40S ribosomal protein S3a [Tupaia chinensis]